MSGVDRVEYLAQRDRINAQLAHFEDRHDQATVLARATAFQRDLPTAWHAATAEQRNAQAKTIVREVGITDDRVTAVLPWPKIALFLNMHVVNTGTGRATMTAPEPDVLRSGSDRDCSISSILGRAHRRKPPHAPGLEATSATPPTLTW